MQDKAKVVLITGAAKRIGAAVAVELHAAGYKLVLHARHSKEEAEQLCAFLNQKYPDSAIVLYADLCDTTQLTTLVASAVAAWGRLDVLVNNASCFIKTPLGDANEADWDELMGANLKAPFFLAQCVSPYLAKAQGCIINITDIHADRPLRDYSVYGVSKAGLLALTRSLAKELAPMIRVNAIAPGMILWPEGDNVLPESLRQKVIGETALKRIGNPHDIAKAVLFFVRDADYITGQVLAVDGGRLL